MMTLVRIAYIVLYFLCPIDVKNKISYLNVLCCLFIWSSIAILKCLSFVVSIQDMNKHSNAVRTVWFPSLTTLIHTHTHTNWSMLSLSYKEMKVTCKHCNRFEISDSNIRRKPVNCFIWFWLKMHLFTWSWITRWWILICNYLFWSDKATLPSCRDSRLVCCFERQLQ